MTLTAKAREAQVVDWFVQWGERKPDVRALILTSTRTNPSFKVDALSDYDLVVVVTDIQPYLEDESWLEDFGRVLVLWPDPNRLEYGFKTFARITQYENGTKVDYCFRPVGWLKALAADPVLPLEFDVGYRVLLDKDGLTAGLQPPTYRAHIPTPPTLEEYLYHIRIFMHEATYVAKHLWRDELMPAKTMLEDSLKQDHLRPMLEWRMEQDHGWAVKAGVMGKGLKKYLPADIWSELERTCVGPGLEENWEAFYRTIALFRRVAIEVGAPLGYDYPEAFHRRCLDYFRHVQELDRSAEVFLIEP